MLYFSIHHAFCRREDAEIFESILDRGHPMAGAVLRCVNVTDDQTVVFCLSMFPYAKMCVCNRIYVRYVPGSALCADYDLAMKVRTCTVLLTSVLPTCHSCTSDNRPSRTTLQVFSTQAKLYETTSRLVISYAVEPFDPVPPPAHQS